MKEAKELFEKYKSGKCTPEEKLLLQTWFHHLAEDEDSGLTEAELREAQKAFRKHSYTLFGKPVSRLWQRVASAAAIILVASLGIYLYRTNLAAEPQPLAGVQENDILPGGNRATLTLADGRRIDLNEARNGELANQSGIRVTKTADGQLVYTISDSGPASEDLSYNTIETPYGGQYQVNLPDGSRVWLNSASSLKYPVHFSGKERKVEITGEVYFEVARNPAMPFRVKNEGQTIEVLGTHFNVMSYPGESTINTTLLEGSVKVFSSKGSKLLTPGQQARNGNGGIDVVTVDTEEVIAWKNGFFIFKSEDAQSIMRQISRWYDVDIEIQGDISRKNFGGRISRSRNISEVLEVLESTGSIKFKIINGGSHENERRIIAMP
ncbi:FecR domain-containing protein [Daejeonella sp. JGW-45]|uniref:FecR domain-containing protein n=1 Tax=Daejeonella sp. JGW-45 TaxID=3034148 RepID=UPI0023EDC96F|nr:FecR domain-containing protein [Daejeonella sp. JGW-45]